MRALAETIKRRRQLASWRTLRALSMALAVTSLAFHPLPAAASDATEMLQRMEAARPDWLPNVDTCPADVMPAREIESGYFEGRCAATLERCLDNCRAGDAADCYASAIILQKVRMENPVSQAHFVKACAMGVTSGCTNRAAGMDLGQGSPCALRTYEKACDRNDPWACTMIGAHLLRGIGIAKDRERARQLLSKSCRYGDADEACRSAKALIKHLGK